MIRRSKPDPSKVCCAIYTRKSSEEGLDQEFNSLDAQRESARHLSPVRRLKVGWLCPSTGLRMADVMTDTARPHLRIRAECAKLNRPRRVPLWWDEGTLHDLTAWKGQRRSHKARADDPFICSLQRATLGAPFNRHVLRRRFVTACRTLGIARQRTLTIHHGRHTFISHALAGARTLAEVRAAAGHSSLMMTSVYLHVAVDDAGEVGRLFECE